METRITEEPAYLYSIWEGELRLFCGKIHIYEMGNDIKRATFICNNKRRQCSNKPLEVYNLSIWMKERNDELAIDTFIQFEIDKIKDLQNTIAARRNMISVLESSRKKHVLE